MLLSIQNITGGYSRTSPVIHNLTFEVKPGETVGLIGLNGAGKSTTMKHILGLLNAHSGSITIDGSTLSDQPEDFRSKIGYIPEMPLFYPELTLWEHLELTASAYGLSDEIFHKRAEQLLKQFQMERARNWFPDTFSKGMQQKIMILCTFLTECKYLIVDEPFVGLDPIAIDELAMLLQQRKEKGTGILISTHILDMAEKLCDRYVCIHQGNIALSGTIEEMRSQAERPHASLHELFISVVKGDHR
ncbi:ABC-2 type transport system ATP-binding protein [Croceifilum oryzae]|uniref:ABC-2 type transport system ATP-binding protein n=1 Tax=Croceifilum oryzae TaxID=1553429 RepID=A0AAJ1WS47_9BACL|nr:ABC transporter ATP-binding protein [Croceifilum oryzae]MDQ0417295.1 ABC-2 type transport system ATP-binding protein [Croceifilum oryzae]